MRFLICAAGSRGDIHPQMGLAESLSQRGHDVRILLNPIYRNLVEENSNCTFVPVGDEAEMRTLLKNPDTLTYNAGWKLWLTHCAVRPIRALYQAIVENYEAQNTVVVGNYLSFGARIAQDHLQVPVATVHMDAHTIRSVNEVFSLPFPGVYGSLVPVWYQYIQFQLMDRIWIDPLVAPGINSFRKELGLKPVSRIAHTWWHSPQLTIGLYPEWWGAPQPDWPSQCVTSDFIFWDHSDETGLPDDVQQFISQGSRPILFTPGTSALHTQNYFSAAIQACQSLGERGIIITDRTDLLPQLPETMRAYRFLPFGPLLSQVSFVVHHGGIGTTAQCLAAGLPQVVIPTLYNQPDTAVRLERLGIARYLHPTKLNAHRLAKAIGELRGSAEVRNRCSEFASRMDPTRGTEITCRLVESLCGTDGGATATPLRHYGSPHILGNAKRLQEKQSF